MARVFTRKRIIFLAVLAAAAAAAFGAYAYFTAGGSGHGGAQVGTTENFGIGGWVSDRMYPGGTYDVDFNAVNPGDGSQRLGTITLTGVKTCPKGFLWYEGAPPGEGSPAGCYNMDPQGLPWTKPEITTCESFSGAASNPGDVNFWMAPVAANQDIPPSAPGTGTVVTQMGSMVMNNLSTSQDTCKNAELLLFFESS